MSGRRRFDVWAGGGVELSGDALAALGINILRHLFVACHLDGAELAGEGLARLIQGHGLHPTRHLP